jgi:hypothetical protein
MADETRGKKVWARRPLEYGGLQVAEGEIFTLSGHEVDAILLRFLYVEEVKKFKKFHDHGPTGRQFIEGGYLEKFGRALARRQDGLTYVEAGYGSYVDTTGDAEARRLASEAPYDLSR